MIVGNKTSDLDHGNIELIKHTRAYKVYNLVKNPATILAKDLRKTDKINSLLAVALVFGIDMGKYLFIFLRFKSACTDIFIYYILNF